MHIDAYLFFNGRCEEALNFYRKAFDAELLMLMRNKESPEPPPPGVLPPGVDDKVMHAALRVGQSTLMLSDGRCSGTLSFTGFSLSVSMPDAAAAERAFKMLAEGGQVQMPLGKTFWSPCFGMVADSFGVPWMVTVVA